jgi:hypothetical protein
MASYIKDIFGREAQARERPLCGSPEVGITILAECVERVL